MSDKEDNDNIENEGQDEQVDKKIKDDNQDQDDEGKNDNTSAEDDKNGNESIDDEKKDLILRTRVGGSPVDAKKKKLLEYDEDEDNNDNNTNEKNVNNNLVSNNETFNDNNNNNNTNGNTLPPAQPPPGWNASISQQQNTFPSFPNNIMNNNNNNINNNINNSSLFPNQFTISPMRRSPPRYYGSMFTYTNPNASRYSTLLSSSSPNNDDSSNSNNTNNNHLNDVEAYQEQRLISQELAKLRSQVVELKKEIERQKQKRRDVKTTLHETQDKYYELEKKTNRSKANENGFRREHSKLKEIAIERRAEIETLQEKLSAMQAELRDTRNHNWTYEKDATTQKRLAEHLSKKLSDVNKKLEDLRNTKQTLLNENETLIDERDNLKTEVENLKEDFARANTLEEELRRDIDGQREKISRLNLEIDSKDGNNGNGNSKNNDNNGIQEDLERKILELESEITVLKEQLQASNEKSLKRKEKASVAKSKLEQVTHDLEVAERERQALLAREASSAHYISQVERQLANYEYQCNVMNDAVQTCQAREQSHIREVARLTEEVRQKKNESNQYQEKMKLSDERLASIEKEKTFIENAYKEESERHKILQTNHEKVTKELEEIKYKYEHYALNQARMVERNDILNETMEKKDFEITKQRRQLENAMETIQKLQKEVLEKTNNINNVIPTIQQMQQQQQQQQIVQKQVITGPPQSNNNDNKNNNNNNTEGNKDADDGRANKLTKNALAGMKRMKKRKAPPRPGGGDKEKNNSSRLAMMKLKLKQELKKQAAASQPKKKPQDFLGLGYKTKESKKLENLVS